MPDIGYYTLPVIPSLRGVEGRVNGDLNRMFGRSGTSAGLAFNRSASRAISTDRSTATALRTQLRQADRALETSMATRSKAVDRLADATGRARVAEKQLTQAQSTGNLARVAAAEERLAAIRRRSASDTRALQSATSGLAQARAAQEAAARAVREGGESGGGGGGGMAAMMLLGRGGMAGLTSMSSSAGMAMGTALRGGIALALPATAIAATFAPLMAGLKAFEWGAEVGLPMERNLNTLRGVTDASAISMTQAGAVARQLGSDTQLAGVTAGDAAAAMTELAKGGMDVNQAMAAARGTVQLATAGQLDAAQAAQYQTAAMNMFGISADKSTHVADLFAAAANASSAEVSDLGMALQQGGSVAGGFGLSIEETMSVLTAFSKLGINASDAGTMMKTSLQAITDQGKPAQEAIHELGLELYDKSTGKFVGYTNMMKQVAAASKNMKDEQFQAATATLFGSDAMRASMIAAKGGPELFQGTADAMNHVDGAAAKMAAAQMHGLPGVLEGLDNTVDGVKLSVYDAGNAIVTALGGEALTALNGFSGWVTTHQSDIIGFFTMAGTSAVSGVRQIVQMAEYGVDALAGIVNAVGDVTGAVTRGMAAFARFTGDTEKANELDKQADAAFGWSDGLEKVVTSLHKTGENLDGFQQRLQTAGDQANEAAKLTEGLAGAVLDVPDGKNIVIRDNTPETEANLKKIGVAITETPTGLTITAETKEAADTINAWRRQQGLEPVDIQVVPKIDPAAQARFDAFAANFKAALSGAASPMPPGLPPGTRNGPEIAPGAGITGIMLPPGVAPPRREHGGVFERYAFGKMPTQAIIQPAKRGLIQWAEPSTHGEAFIPLNPGNRERSRAIHAETGRRLGITGYAQGALVGPDVQVARAMMGTDYDQGDRTDCSGMVARVILGTLGLPNTGLMSTKNASSWLAKLGFKPGTGGAGAISVGWYDHGPNPNDGHMAMTLSDGSNAEAGGSHGNFLIGGDAKGANSPGFDQHMFLPIDAMYGEGQGGNVSGFGFGTNTGGGGTVDPTKVREANERVADADQRIREADARVAEETASLKELAPDAKESQRISAQRQLDAAKADAEKARREKGDALAGLSEAQAGDPGKGGSSGGGGADDIGGIMSSFFKETFGFGDWLPDLANLGPIKMLNAFMGLRKGTTGNNTTSGASPFGGGGAGGGGGDLFGNAAGAAFGMIPGIVGSPTNFDPGMNAPPMPVGAAHIPGAGPNAPGPIDQSNNVAVTVNGYSQNEVVNGVRRELQWAPRQQTYTPPGAA